MDINKSQIKISVQLAIRSNACRLELMTVEYSPSLMPLTSHTAWIQQVVCLDKEE